MRISIGRKQNYWVDEEKGERLTVPLSSLSFSRIHQSNTRISGSTARSNVRYCHLISKRIKRIKRYLSWSKSIQMMPGDTQGRSPLLVHGWQHQQNPMAGRWSQNRQVLLKTHSPAFWLRLVWAGDAYLQLQSDL